MQTPMLEEQKRKIKLLTDSGGVRKRVSAPTYALTIGFKNIYMPFKEQCIFLSSLIHVKLHQIALVLNKYV